MARAGLKWTVRQLAAEAKIGVMTLSRFEQEIVQSNESTIAALRRIFEARNVTFGKDGSVRIDGDPVQPEPKTTR